jgi:hypothetical protein
MYTMHIKFKTGAHTVSCRIYYLKLLIQMNKIW